MVMPYQLNGIEDSDILKAIRLTNELPTILFPIARHKALYKALILYDLLPTYLPLSLPAWLDQSQKKGYKALFPYIPPEGLINIGN